MVYDPSRPQSVLSKPLTNPVFYKGVSGVAHVASVIAFDVGDPHKVITPTIAGAINALTAAEKCPSVKRLVYTSSSTAMTKPKPNKVFSVDAATWNQEDVDDAWKPPPYEPSRAWAVYGASKTQAEQEVWEFVKEHHPHFTVNAVLPNANFGEILSPSQPTSTGAWIPTLYNATTFPPQYKPFLPQWMVNVTDTALLHVSALLDPEVQNERVLGFAEPYNWNDILAVLRKLEPGRKFPEDLEGCPRDLMQVPNQRGAELLRRLGREGWKGLEESVRENLAHLRG